MDLAIKSVLSSNKSSKYVAYWKKCKYLAYAFFLLLFFLAESAQAQSYWKKSSNKARRLAVKEASSEPNHQYFRLDKVAFERALGATTNSGVSARSNATVQIPNADGSMETYRITPTQVLSQSVAKEHPTIKTYVGQSVSNPKKQISFVWSDFGLSGIVMEDFSYSFIDAEDNNGEFYKVYYRKDSRGEVKPCSTPHSPRLTGAEEAVESHQGHHRPTYQTQKRVYTVRLAIACTSAFTEAAGGTKSQTLAFITGTVNRINMIYGAQMSVKFELVSGDNLIYDDPATDPTKDFNYSKWDYPGYESVKLQGLINTTIGVNNYDIGHLFHKGGNSGNAGQIRGILYSFWKARAYSFYSFTGDRDRFDVDVVAHEIGHQVGAYHTLSYYSEKESDPAWSNIYQMEPGSASTIMGYAGVTYANPSVDVQPHSDPYFHHRSVWQITRTLNQSTATYTAHDNSRPNFNGDEFKDYTIPKGTAFVLSGVATDTATDKLLYTWEQADDFKGSWSPYRFSGTHTTGPVARSIAPSENSVRYIPRLSTIVSGNITATDNWETVPTVGREMHWSLVVTDRPFIANQTGNTAYKTITVTVEENAGPFKVTSQEQSSTWTVGQTATITWDVANTNIAPVNTDKVDILFSTDGGSSFLHTLATAIPNTGSAVVTATQSITTSQGRFMIKANGNIFLAVNKGTITVNESGVTPPTPPTPTLPDGPILISNAFTPNGDGINDTYVIARAENYPNNTLQVFNTLGQLIYQTKGYKNQWDGKMANGTLVPQGSYIAIFSPDGSDQKKQQTWIYINY
ncbi:hypothetical protein RCZ04_12010 [Capnocytophaga sp. HP1101]